MRYANDLAVRIEELPPMRVASIRAVSATPEQEAWARLMPWAQARGFLDDVEAHPVFGFNNPNPSPDRDEYGYELWIRVPEDTPPDDDVEVKHVEGGRYAVVTHEGLPNPDVWMRLWAWVKSSPHEWRETHELERAHDPLAAPENMVFDLYLPIL